MWIQRRVDKTLHSAPQKGQETFSREGGGEEVRNTAWRRPGFWQTADPRSLCGWDKPSALSVSEDRPGWMSPKCFPTGAFLPPPIVCGSQGRWANKIRCYLLFAGRGHILSIGIWPGIDHSLFLGIFFIWLPGYCEISPPPATPSQSTCQSSCSLILPEVGVLQSSNLGPLVFFIYPNSLGEFI